MAKWINETADTTSIEPKLPGYIKDMIQEMITAEAENNSAVYYTVCDDFEVQTKYLIPDVIDTKEWNLLCKRYSFGGD